jgi:Carboxypeptidase regulatory-like domain
MARRFLIGILVFVTSIACVGFAQEVGLSPAPISDKNQDQGRNVVGQVLTKSDAPIAEAVVYLKNTKTLTIKSFISEKDGGYRFHGLSQNIDYEIYADYQGQKSPTKTISSFDTRNNITLNIHIDTK